jgi:signal transduction histidine kinase
VTDASIGQPVEVSRASRSFEERSTLTGGGLGLILVQGLVSRELGGTFSLSYASPGANHTGDGAGSVARVEFPVSADEIS